MSRAKAISQRQTRETAPKRDDTARDTGRRPWGDAAFVMSVNSARGAFVRFVRLVRGERGDCFGGGGDFGRENLRIRWR